MFKPLNHIICSLSYLLKAILAYLDVGMVLDTLEKYMIHMTSVADATNAMLKETFAAEMPALSCNNPASSALKASDNVAMA